MAADITPTTQNSLPSWGPHGEPVLGAMLSGHARCPRYRAGRRALLQSPEVPPSSVPLPPSKPDRNNLSLALWAVSAAKPGPGPHVSPSLSRVSVCLPGCAGKMAESIPFTCFFIATCSAHFLLLCPAPCTLFLTIVP